MPLRDEWKARRFVRGEWLPFDLALKGQKPARATVQYWGLGSTTLAVSVNCYRKL